MESHTSTKPPPSHAWLQLLGLVIFVVAIAAYTAYRIQHGWIAEDAGANALAALLVTQDRLPNLDFIDVYPGGHAYFHSTIFQLFGVSLRVLRWTLWAGAMVMGCVFYALARQFVGRWAALLGVALALTWSVSSYPVAMSSWWCLILILLGLFCMMRYRAESKLHWLWLAGLTAGATFMMKTNGLYITAAWMLVLVYHEQERAAALPVSRLGKLAHLLVIGPLLVFTAIIVWLIRWRSGLAGFLVFVVPIAACAGLLAWRELNLGPKPILPRLKTMVREHALLGLGALLPVVVCLLPFILTGTVHEWLDTVFVRPMVRLSLIFPPPSPFAGLAVLPLAACLAFCLAPHRFNTICTRWGATLLALLATAGVLYGSHDTVYRLWWASAIYLAPVLAVAGAVYLARAAAPTAKHHLTFLCLITMSMFNLFQFPFSVGSYFCYVAPLVVLAMLTLCGDAIPRLKSIVAPLAASYLLFAILWVNGTNCTYLGYRCIPTKKWVRLEANRGNIFLSEGDAQGFMRIVNQVRKHSLPGSAILALPDSPHIYFLAERRNPTPTLYDVFDPDYKDEKARVLRLHETINREQINVVVIRDDPETSPRLSPAMAYYFNRRFPHAYEVKPYTVRWAEDTP